MRIEVDLSRFCLMPNGDIQYSESGWPELPEGARRFLPGERFTMPVDGALPASVLLNAADVQWSGSESEGPGHFLRVQFLK